MNKLKVKTIQSSRKEEFDREMEKLINTSADASIQYRTSATNGHPPVHSAMVIYLEKGEEETGLTNIPTSVKGSN